MNFPRSLPVPGAVALAVLAGCGDPELRAQELPPEPAVTLSPYDPRDDVAAGQSALTLVPADATVVTITDFDESRATLGVPDLTSDDLMSDRTGYWERARRESVLLTEGMLLAENSRLMLDYGFTRDDVDWEAHFTTPSGPGWILGFRPDLDLAPVERAVQDGVAGLSGAVVDPERHLVSVGMATKDEESWGTIEGVADPASDTPAESTYYRVGCVPLGTALGPDADIEDRGGRGEQARPERPRPAGCVLGELRRRRGHRPARPRSFRPVRPVRLRLPPFRPWARSASPTRSRSPWSTRRPGASATTWPRPSPPRPRP
ncbi:hypothetical protein [Nocardioides sp. B-3]|uniref:hypothetical protein n=1 Tax=Nocardioides sp. B-3 TaxID=2895565 RepID=UPI002152EBBF|nr:hypothetical protein [Nocardioides sp. B-3]UUZ61085.1 hypothetical protein LP418_10760 [Nocardioides sp. B-3]